MHPWLVGCLVFLPLAWLALAPAPYEQDQIAKAAKVLSLDHGEPLLSEENYYHDETFTLYFLVLKVVHAAFHKDIFVEMNLASAVAGGIFCAFIAATLRRVYLIPVWVTMLLALNTPEFLHVFAFGNETAFSLAAVSAVLWLLTQPVGWRCVLAGIVFGLGIHFRPDLLFLVPFVLAWIGLRSEGASGQDWFRRAIVFLFIAGAVSLGYWLAVVRRMPTEGGFQVSFVPRYFAAILLYPFGPVLALAALYGIKCLFHERRRDAFGLLLVFVPLLYCAPMLSSPKFVAILMLPVWILAGIGVSRNSRLVRMATVGLAGVFWLYSVSPFGVFHGARGAVWFLPTDDNALPTGSYVWFYQNVHDGFYQERYVSEIASVDEAVQGVLDHPDHALAGFFNPQSFLYANALHSRYDLRLKGFPWTSGNLHTNQAYYLPRTSYTRLDTFDPASRDRIYGWLADGRVRPLHPEAGNPFPAVIEVGPQVAAGENRDLGRRILFSFELTGGHGYIPRKFFADDLQATRWVTTASRSAIGAKNVPAYVDGEFACYTNDVGRGTIYSSLMPLRYFGVTDPRKFMHQNEIKGSP